MILPQTCIQPTVCNLFFLSYFCLKNELQTAGTRRRRAKGHSYPYVFGGLFLRFSILTESGSLSYRKENDSLAAIVSVLSSPITETIALSNRRSYVISKRGIPNRISSVISKRTSFFISKRASYFRRYIRRPGGQ